MKKCGFLPCLAAVLLAGMVLLGSMSQVSAKAMARTGELLDAAKIMVAGAQNKAKEINVPMVISVVDMDGNLVLLHRMEGSLLASLEISPNKAYTAVALKMPSSDVKKLAQEGQELQGVAIQHAGRLVEFGGGLPSTTRTGNRSAALACRAAAWLRIPPSPRQDWMPTRKAGR